MTLLNKSNTVKVILAAVGVLCLVTFFLDYVGYKYEKIPSFERISKRRVHKYAQPSDNFNRDLLFSAPLIVSKTRKSGNLSVINSSNAKDLEPTQTFNISRLFTDDTYIKIFNITHTNINKNISLCADPDIDTIGILNGPITPNMTLESLDTVEAELKEYLKAGGFFEPKLCKSKHHVAIVVPFRDRYAHLSIFLRNMHPFLMMQNISYRIFVMEQTNGKPFNRAALMNVGFLEALKIYSWDCFIFHDVDLLPLDDRNIYNCPRQPRHMSVAIDVFNFKLPYRSIFGGVSAMTKEHFAAVNGFSNSYFGWGGEDDDMSNRIKHANLFISRYPVNIARYTMMKHQKEKANPKRFENLFNGISKIESDGINSIKYEIYSFKEFPTFTWYLVEFKLFPETKS